MADAKWTYTVPAKDGACWADAKYYLKADTACATVKTDTTDGKFPATAKVGAELEIGATGSTKKWVIKSCAADKVDFHLIEATGTEPDTAAKAYALVTADLAAGKKFSYTVKKAEAEVDGKQKCQALGDDTHLVSWTLSGWAKPAEEKKTDAAATGAKTLAAAFTAGALAVAATQF